MGAEQSSAAQIQHKSSPSRVVRTASDSSFGSRLAAIDESAPLVTPRSSITGPSWIQTDEDPVDTSGVNEVSPVTNPAEDDSPTHRSSSKNSSWLTPAGQDGLLREGMAVEIVGLTKDARLNGKTGRLASLDAASGVWRVRVQGEGLIRKMKADNLRLVPQDSPRKQEKLLTPRQISGASSGSTSTVSDASRPPGAGLGWAWWEMKEGAFVVLKSDFTQPLGPVVATRFGPRQSATLAPRLGAGGVVLKMLDETASIKFRGGTVVVPREEFAHLEVVEEGPIWLLAERDGTSLMPWNIFLDDRVDEAWVPQHYRDRLERAGGGDLAGRLWYRVAVDTVFDAPTDSSRAIGRIGLNEVFEVDGQEQEADTGRVWLKLSDDQGWVLAQDTTGAIFCRSIQVAAGLHVRLTECATDIHGEDLTKFHHYTVEHMCEMEFFRLRTAGGQIRLVSDLRKFAKADELTENLFVRFGESRSYLCRDRLRTITSIDESSMIVRAVLSGGEESSDLELDVDISNWESVHVVTKEEINWEATLHCWTVFIRMLGIVLAGIVIELILVLTPTGSRWSPNTLSNLSCYLASSRHASRAFAVMAVVPAVLMLIVWCVSWCPTCFVSCLRWSHVPWKLNSRAAHVLREEGYYRYDQVVFTLNFMAVFALTHFPLCVRPFHGEDCNDDCHKLLTLAVFAFPFFGVFRYVCSRCCLCPGVRTSSALTLAVLFEACSVITMGINWAMFEEGGTGGAGGNALYCMSRELLAIWLLLASALARLMTEFEQLGSESCVRAIRHISPLLLVLFAWIPTVMAREPWLLAYFT